MATPTNPLAPTDLIGYEGDLDTAQRWLDVAWRALFAEIPGLAERYNDGVVDQELVHDTVVSAALRVLRNPGGYESESGGLDDYQESWKLANATEDVYFTKAELRRLGWIDPATTGFAGSIKYI